MGVRNVRRALAVEAGKTMSPWARLVLIAMSVHALDHDQSPTRRARLFYGGHAMIASTLGLMPTDSSKRRVRRGVAELTALGLVEAIAHGGGGGKFHVYELHLSPVDSVVDNRRDGP